MNIEKIVAICLDKRRAQSQKQRKLTKSNSYVKKNSQYNSQNVQFRPSINQLPQSIYKATTKTQCSRQEIVQRLYTDRRNIDGIRTQIKLKEEQKEFHQNCTFQPQLNLVSKKILKTEGQDQDPFQRLYTDALNKKKFSDSLYLLQQNKQNYSFQPETNYKNVLNSQTCNMKPIYERIDEIIKEKRKNLKILQQEADKQELKIKPTISETSQKILQNRNQFKKNILVRISDYIEQKKRKQQKDTLQREINITKQCTFKPQINNSIQVSTNFMHRQQQFIKKLESKMNSRVERNNFQPQINKISQILVRQQRQYETMQDKIIRLTNDVSKRQKIDQIQRELYQQCTFQPQINAISKCLVAQHVSHKCDHMHQKQEQYEFRPKINKISEILARNKRGQSVDLAEQRKENIDKIKMQNQYQQLKQCTFKPKINYSKPKSVINLSDVPGFNVFNKKISKINQLKEEQKQRQQRLFKLDKKYKSRKSTTPNQFKLSQGYNTKQAVKQQMKEKFQKQCPFRPQITTIR